MFFCVRASQWELVGEEIPNAAAFSLISGINLPERFARGSRPGAPIPFWRYVGAKLTGKAITSKSNTQVRITSKGQVTIPQEFRERFGLLPNTEVEFVATPDGKELRLLKSSKPSGRGRALDRTDARTGHRQTFHRRTSEIDEK